MGVLEEERGRKTNKGGGVDRAGLGYMLSDEEAALYAGNALKKKYRVITRPVDKRENYIKRAVGMP